MERFSLGPSRTPKGRTTAKEKKVDKRGTRSERGRKVQALNTSALGSMWQKRSKIEENKREKEKNSRDLLRRKIQNEPNKALSENQETKQVKQK